MSMKKIRNTVCLLCAEDLTEITFRNSEALRHFTSGQNKILPRKKTGCCAKHQRLVSREIKRGREMAMLAYRGQ